MKKAFYSKAYDEQLGEVIDYLSMASATLQKQKLSMGMSLNQKASTSQETIANDKSPNSKNS
jgi:hypothetical protein